jgi:hypothetical protein
VRCIHHKVKAYQVQLCCFVLASGCASTGSPVATDSTTENSSGGSSAGTSVTSNPGSSTSTSSPATTPATTTGTPSSNTQASSSAATTQSTSTQTSNAAATADSATAESSTPDNSTADESSASSASDESSATVSASTDDGGSTSRDTSQGETSSGPSLPPIDDYTEMGPFTPIMEDGVGPDGAYTVYRPETLGADGFLHAPIIFGPGITQQVTVHTQMLSNFASHGFVVVGTPVLEGRPGDPGNLEKLQRGLDWILEQNTVQGMYEGKLWTDHAVAMGFSVGGTSAVQVGGDPSILTVVSIHGHAATAELHGTMLQTTGTEDGVGMPLQQQTFDDSDVPTFLATLTDAPHQYIEREGGGEERPVILAWMRYWIYGDAGAEGFFFGDDCKACVAPWENPQRKNWDAISGQ